MAKPTTTTQTMNKKRYQKVSSQPWIDENNKKVIHKNMNINVTIKKTLGGGYHKKWHYNEGFNEHTNIEFWSQWRKDNGYDSE